MYNPANLHECEMEKSERREHRAQKPMQSQGRVWADRIMLLVGGVASLSSLPQALKIFQTGTVAGLSLSTQLIGLGAVVAWFIYGLYIKNHPLILTTLMTIVILSTVVVQIFIYG